MITSLLLTSHVILFSVKLFTITILFDRIKQYSYLAAWSILYLLVEVWFLHKFFIDIDLYYYEVFAIIDQCIFTGGLVFYLIKEDDNGKRTEQREYTTP